MASRHFSVSFDGSFWIVLRTILKSFGTFFVPYRELFRNILGTLLDPFWVFIKGFYPIKIILGCVLCRTVWDLWWTLILTFCDCIFKVRMHKYANILQRHPVIQLKISLTLWARKFTIWAENTQMSVIKHKTTCPNIINTDTPLGLLSKIVPFFHENC